MKYYAPALIGLVSVFALSACDQLAPAQQPQAQAPVRSEIVSFDFREDGRKVALVQDPDGSLRLCELRGGEELRWDCTPLPPV